MSHEVSITFQIGEDWYNVPSIVKGRREPLSQEEAKARVKNKTLKPHGVFDSLEDATIAAQKRSRSFDKRKKNKKASGGTVKKSYNNPTRKANYK